MTIRESSLWLVLDARRARRQGPEAIARRQRARLAEMVSFARTASPYYRALYRALPERVEDPTLLPVTDKQTLMARFGDWVTDPKVKEADVRAFVEDSGLIGERFLGRYTVATTSGTTGSRGIFLLDDRSFAVTAALAARMLSAWLSVGDVFRIFARGGRMAMVNATGGHFASAVAGVRLRRSRGERVQVFPVDMRRREMVQSLNEFRPAILAAYASMGALLAGDQESGRLRITPVLVVLSAEGLPSREYDRIASAFDATVRDSYAATECPFLSYRCEDGWLHVNSDWAVLEPVDAEYRPVPPGTQSNTVLVSNLANRVQPVLRYDLGDSVVQRPDACPCGNPLPAVRVQGRTADVLAFAGMDGERVEIAPLMISSAVGEAPSVARFQIVQVSSHNLRVRLALEGGTDSEQVWQEVSARVTRLLARHRLSNVTVERGEEPPERTPGGKYREVVPLAKGSEA